MLAHFQADGQIEGAKDGKRLLEVGSNELLLRYAQPGMVHIVSVYAQYPFSAEAFERGKPIAGSAADIDYRSDAANLLQNDRNNASGRPLYALLLNRKKTWSVGLHSSIMTQKQSGLLH